MRVSIDGDRFTDMIEKSGLNDERVPWYVSGSCLCIYMICTMLQAVVVFGFSLIYVFLMLTGSVVLFLFGLLLVLLSPFKILIDKLGRKSE